MKQKPHPTSNIQSGFNADQFRRHYVSAIDTDQTDAWSETESTGYLGRVFMFLLLLHVFLIGAVVLYNVVADKPKGELDKNVSHSKKTDTLKKDAVVVTKAKSKDSTNPTVSNKNVEMDEYQVRSGDSLKSITDATGVKPEDIIRINQLDANGELFVGRKLMLPKKKAGDVAAPKAVPVPSPVQQVASIAPAKIVAPPAETPKSSDPVKPQELSPKMVAKPKSVEKAKLQLEQSLSKPVAIKAQDTAKEMLPEENRKTEKSVESAPPKAKPVTEANIANVAEPPKEATVKPMLSKTDKAASLKNSTIKTAGSSGSTHGVKPGETFYSIARKYGVGVNELMKLNGYTNAGSLREGVKLKMPSKG